LVVLLLAFATLLALGVGTAAPASAARPQPAADALATFTATATNGTPVTGVVDVNRFVAQADGTLAAVGTATVTNPATGQSATQAVTLLVDLAASTGSCQILDLVLGPLDLDLLGLVIHLDQVHLNITAQQGPGNLLGNLLCAVAGLLDGPGGLTNLLNGITALLNQILGALG
jgi:hypothetical protein